LTHGKTFDGHAVRLVLLEAGVDRAVAVFMAAYGAPERTHA